MTCKYYKKGYFGVCCALEPYRVASISEMEQYCFQETFMECPRFELSALEKNLCAGALIRQNKSVSGASIPERGWKETLSLRNELA